MEVSVILKFILYSFLIFLAFSVIAVLFFYLLGVVNIIFQVVGVILVIVATIYVCMWLFGPKKKGGVKASLKSQTGTVAFFEDQPTAVELTLVETSLSKSIKISADSDVEILDQDRDTVKVKIRSGENKGKVGWVSASDIDS